jgi:hypothetical protein
VVIAFPDYARYRELAAETAATVGAVGVEIWFVSGLGEVTVCDRGV